MDNHLFRKVLGIFLISCAFSMLSSQVTFFESYSFGGMANTIYDFQKTQDNQYTLLGMQIYGEEGGQWEPCPAGFSIDLSGNQTNEYQIFSMDKCNIITDEGNIIQPGIDNLHFMMGEAVGDSLPPNIPYDLLFTKACRYDDSHWLIAGTHIGDWTVYLICSDEEGHISWISVLPSNVNFSVSDMIRADEDRIILAGFSNQLVVVDNLGNYLEDLETITANGNPRLIKNSHSEEIIVVLRDPMSNIHLYSFMNRTLSQIMEVQGFASQCFNVLADGEQLIYSGTFQGNPNTVSTVFKIERSGLRIWQYDIPFEFTIQDAGNIISTPDSCYFVAGIFHPDSSPYFPEFGIIKLSNNGTPVSDEIHPTPGVSIAAYPNPFANEIAFDIKVKDPGLITSRIHNIRGQLVKDIDTEYIGKRTSPITWDARDNYGNKVKPGVYFIKVSTATQSLLKKIVYLK